MIPADRRQFFEVLGESQQAQETAKVQLLEALSYFYGDPEADEHGEQLQVWTSLRYEALGPPTSFLSSIAIGKDEVVLRIPRLRKQVADLLEYEPDHVRLVVVQPGSDAPPPGLDIDLALWLALSKIKRGMPQRYHDPVIGRRLEDFMSRVAAQRRNRRGGYAQLHVRDVERGDTYRIDVSLELKKYRL